LPASSTLAGVPALLLPVRAWWVLLLLLLLLVGRRKACVKQQ
jgi:hypothetical protein